MTHEEWNELLGEINRACLQPSHTTAIHHRLGLD